jgi:hypothetical protein
LSSTVPAWGSIPNRGHWMFELATKTKAAKKKGTKKKAAKK